MVSLVTFVSELSLVAIGVLGLRYERNWLFYFALTSGAIGSAVWVVQFQGARTVWAGPWDIVLVPCTIGIAAITRTRMRAARGLAFDRELWSAVDDVSKLLKTHPDEADVVTYDEWAEKTSREGQSVLQRVSRLKPPDPERRRALELYSDLLSKTVAAIPTGVSDAERRDLIRLRDEAFASYQAVAIRDGRRN